MSDDHMVRMIREALLTAARSFAMSYETRSIVDAMGLGDTGCCTVDISDPSGNYAGRVLLKFEIAQAGEKPSINITPQPSQSLRH